MGLYAQFDVSPSEIAESAERDVSPCSWPGSSELAIREPAALRAAIRLLGKACQDLPASQDDARRLLTRAAAVLQAELDFRDQVVSHGEVAARCRLVPWQVRRVMHFIDANLSTKIGPRDLADLVRLSVSHFARVFRATVGKSPRAFLIHRRIERAKEMMLETELPLVQIALACGLADQSHFTKRFTRIVGMSPAAWRRVHAPRPAGHVLQPLTKAAGVLIEPNRIRL
jgi:AraC family transcriptional regulator